MWLGKFYQLNSSDFFQRDIMIMKNEIRIWSLIIMLFTGIVMSACQSVPVEEQPEIMPEEPEIVESVPEITIKRYILTTDVYFSSGSLEVDDYGQKKLDIMLYEARGASVTISANGYSDPLGSAEDNMKLSEQRAMAVKNYLMKRGLAESAITTQGFGATNSVVGDICNGIKKKKEKALCYEPDRRVEVRLEGTKSAE